MEDRSNDYLAYLTQLESEHEQLQHRVRRIDDAWLDRDSTLTREKASAILAELQQLRADLAHHFEMEESGGCLDEAIARQPRLGQAADEVLNQHPQLMRRLDDLVAQLQFHTLRGNVPRELKRDFLDFVTHLTEHESIEVEILYAGFGVDLES